MQFVSFDYLLNFAVSPSFVVLSGGLHQHDGGILSMIVKIDVQESFVGTSAEHNVTFGSLGDEFPTIIFTVVYHVTFCFEGTKRDDVGDAKDIKPK